MSVPQHTPRPSSSMNRIHVLTSGFNTPNGGAFLFPLVVYRHILADYGYTVTLHRAVTSKLLDCDTLIIDSKFYRDQWAKEASAVIEALKNFRKQIPKLIYCDTTDSTGSLQVAVLPIVDCYAKAQLLRDRSKYKFSYYGHRIYTDYYHRHAGVADDEPDWSEPISENDHLKKLAVSWNSGLADYSLLGPARMSLYSHFPVSGLLSFPRPIASPDHPRPIQLHTRMGTMYARASVSYQRQMILSRLGSLAAAGKIRRRSYLNELSLSQSVLSPFGLGEITLKDFEVFLSGACLIKPDMTHLETWPDLFRPGETIACFDWDFADFDSVLTSLYDDSESRIAVATAGQENYQQYLDPDKGSCLFVKHFANLLSKIQRK